VLLTAPVQLNFSIESNIMNVFKTLLATTAIGMTASFAVSGFANEADMTNAEVRKVDKDAKKITLKHEAIKNLDMPGMTMVFQVKDAALLDKTKVGDKVKFKAIQEGSAYVVTDIHPEK
jgi:Cu(I)/Ag(I) efflux system periplasmic protein CusF